MSALSIVITIVVVVLILILLRYIFADPYTLQSIQNGETTSTILATSLATNGSSVPSTNFAYSVWFYINDWNYRYGSKKVLFGRMGNTTTSTTPPPGPNAPAAAAATASSIDNIQQLEPCPAVIFGAMDNNVSISLACFNSPDTTATGSGSTNIHTCTVSNIPIQRWVNLIVSVYGRSLDVYIDGKLVRTCLLPGIASVKTNSDLFVTPMGGFSGWTSRLQYWPNAFNPQQAWNTYTKGYKTAIFGSSYQVQVSLLENGSAQNTFTVG
jgi:hypothetical protein